MPTDSFSTDASETKMGPLRVMSYNIRYDALGDTGPLSWTNRRDKVASMMRFHGADIVGTQEGKQHQLTQIESQLPEYAWVGTGRKGETGEFSALFYKTDRLALLEHNTFWLSDTPRTPGSTSWGNTIPRIATWARFRDRSTGSSLLVLNTHLDNKNADARLKGARLIIDRLDILTTKEPAIVTGDINATEDSPPYQALTQSGNALSLRDALHAAESPHHGPTSTFNDFGPTVLSDQRIDYIFVSPEIAVRRHGHLNERWNENYPSDHLPVLAEVVLPA